MSGEQKVTISMVSEQAGVSKTTVSRFLNGKYEYMSVETRERIQQVIDELQYRPNPIARSLKSKHSGLIGIIVADITNPFSSVLVKGVNDACAKASYRVLVANTDNDSDKEREYLQSMLDHRVEGIILNTVGGNDEYIYKLHEQGIPIALADRRMEGNLLDTVTTDNERITAEMIRLVYEQGFERIAFFTNVVENSTTRKRRYDTFMEVSRGYVSKPADLVYVIGQGEGCFPDYTDALRQATQDHAGHALAVFTVNGVVLLGVLNAINKLELEIPTDVGVCGFEDWGWAGIVRNGISVISQPSYEVGTKSAELLIKRIREGKRRYRPRYIELSCSLQLRGSTNIAKE